MALDFDLDAPDFREADLAGVFDDDDLARELLGFAGDADFAADLAAVFAPEVTLLAAVLAPVVARFAAGFADFATDVVFFAARAVDVPVPFERSTTDMDWARPEELAELPRDRTDPATSRPRDATLPAA